MRVLFDTQLWIWYATRAHLFPNAARDVLTDPRNEIAWTVVSIREIAVKHALRRPDFDLCPEDMPAVLRSAPFTELPVLAEHTLPAGTMPPLHRDPFDRILISQAAVGDMVLLTADRQLPAYPGVIRRV